MSDKIEQSVAGPFEPAIEIEHPDQCFVITNEGAGGRLSLTVQDVAALLNALETQVAERDAEIARLRATLRSVLGLTDKDDDLDTWLALYNAPRYDGDRDDA